jgi:Cd2+-exporting ATPase
LVSGDAKAFTNNDFPAGLSSMSVIVDNIVITYGTKLVGAGVPIQNTFDAPVRLAPPQPPQDLPSRKRHARKVTYTTLISALLTIPVLILSRALLPPKPNLYSVVSQGMVTIV